MNPPPPHTHTCTHTQQQFRSNNKTLIKISEPKKTETHFPRNVATLWVDAYHKDLNGMKG